MKNLKMVVIGDGNVGKTTLLLTYITNEFTSGYVPSILNYNDNVMTVGDQPYGIAFTDTAGHEDYPRLRPLLYPQTDVFLICFSVDSPRSFENVKTLLIPEVQYHCPDYPIVIVACKTDLRSGSSEEMVSYSQGMKLASDMNASYCETSALTQEGLRECFEHVVSVFISTPKPTKAFFGLRKSKFERQAIVRVPPVMPPAGKAPRIEVKMSTFADDWYRALQDPKFHDVTFILEEGKRRLHAHSIVLCASSSFFGKLLAIVSPIMSSQQHELNEIEGFSREELMNGSVEGISSVHESDDGSEIELKSDIKAKTFVRVLEFLYTGMPRIQEDAAEEELQDLKRMASTFKLLYLTTICDNIIQEEEFLNPSIRTDLNDETGTKMKSLFFNQPKYADVVFNVEDKQVYAHKVILSTRNNVMAAMFSGNFLESQSGKRTEITIPETTHENFCALVEYFYTDHFLVEQTSDVVGLLTLADEKGQSRLVNLCELYISEMMEKACQNKIEKADIDVIGLLNTAHMSNAGQLVKWCLHFISTNFDAFSNREEFSYLTDEDRVHVEENRWPPLIYWKAMEKFEKEKKAKVEKDKCVIM